MGHPFEVGRTYRNRDGEYEVVLLDGPKMVIRYSNGRRVETTVKLQARIWKNIQAEERTRSRARKRTSAPQRPRRRRQRGLGFQGLQDHDFQKGVAGTHWRARTGLGGLLAQRLSDTSGRFFQSYAIYRQAAVHIAQPSYYDSKLKWQQAKFVFQLDSQGANYGFYIEKNEGPMDDTWDWPRFLTALGSDPALRQQVDSAMKQLGLHWEVYVWDDGGLIAQVKALPMGLTWEWEQTDDSEDIRWAAFTERLDAIDTEKWCDLYLCNFLAKEDAIAAGFQIVDPVIEVYQALLPLYEASAPRTGSGRRDS